MVEGTRFDDVLSLPIELIDCVFDHGSAAIPRVLFFTLDPPAEGLVRGLRGSKLRCEASQSPGKKAGAFWLV